MPEVSYLKNRQKRQKRIVVTMLVVIVILTMVASGGAMFFSNSGIPTPGNGNTSADSTASATADYQAKKASAAALAQQAKTNPTDVSLQTDLGNAYYDAGLAAESAAPAEATDNYKNAVTAYQNVLKSNKDVNVMVDMATAAFKSGQNDLAEKTYQEALALKPDFVNGLVDYGIFLANVKQDLKGAIAQWEKAEQASTDATEKSQISDLISQAQSGLNGGGTTSSGSGSLNPALNGGATNAAPTGQ